MRKISGMLCAVILIIGMSACKSKESNRGDQSKSTFDRQGTYTGIIPCADCPGIQLQITLNQDYTYKIVEEYQGKKYAVYKSAGTFQWESGDSYIVLNDLNGRPSRYKTGENTLTQLDMYGNVISGELAENYILVKIDEELVDKHWTLVELLGNPVDPQENIYITFHQNSRVSGNSGCNTFSGNYQLKTDYRHFALSHLITTQKMCLNMDTEDQVNKVLASVDNYVVNNDTLILNRARMAPLAKFEVR
jgi:heat shock protein HslJ